MKEPIFSGKEIEKIIPQRAPIIMVDKLFGVGEEHSFTGLTVSTENIFCEEGVLQEAGIIEHIAQSAAARVGYIYLQRGKPVPLGFIGSVDKLTISHLPETGNELYTVITVLQELFDITLISARVTTGDTLVAECKMKIFIKPE